MRTDDPLRDYARHEAEQEETAERLPKCDRCHERIYEYVWEIEGATFCDDCAKELFRSEVN